MSITPTEIQQALRISKSIEQHLSVRQAVNVRSEDLYPMLADGGLVERDNEKGKHFRAFLVKLYKANMLSLIPQCRVLQRAGGKYDWTFNRAGDRMPARKPGTSPVALTPTPE